MPAVIMGSTIETGRNMSATMKRAVPSASMAIAASHNRLVMKALMTVHESRILNLGRVSTAFFCMYVE